MNHILLVVSCVLLGCAAQIPKHPLRETPASEVQPLSVEQLSKESSYEKTVHAFIYDPSISCESLLEIYVKHTELLLRAAYWYNKRSRQEPVRVALEILENKLAAIAMYGEEKWKEDPDPEELYSWLGPRVLREQVAALKGILSIGFHVLGRDCGDIAPLEAATYGDPEAIQQPKDNPILYKDSIND